MKAFLQFGVWLGQAVAGVGTRVKAIGERSGLFRVFRLINERIHRAKKDFDPQQLTARLRHTVSTWLRTVSRIARLSYMQVLTLATRLKEWWLAAELQGKAVLAGKRLAFLARSMVAKVFHAVSRLPGWAANVRESLVLARVVPGIRSLGDRLSEANREQRLRAIAVGERSGLFRIFRLISERIHRAKADFDLQQLTTRLRHTVSTWLGTVSRIARLSYMQVLTLGTMLKKRWLAAELQGKAVFAGKRLAFLARSTVAKILQGVSKLPGWAANVRESLIMARVVPGIRSLGDRLSEAYREQRLWAIAAVGLVIVIAARLVTFAFANSGRGQPDRLARQSAASGVSSGEAPPGTTGLPQGAQPLGTGFSLDLFLATATPDPVDDFAGALILGVTHLSSTSSMVQIHIPHEPRGTYRAVIEAPQVLDYPCISLQGYTDRLFCIGPRLVEGSLIVVRIFRIEDRFGGQNLVFEAEYDFQEPTSPTVPVPELPTYGGAFTWPDRHVDQMRKRSESADSQLHPNLFSFVGLVLLFAALIWRTRGNAGDIRTNPAFETVPRSDSVPSRRKTSLETNLADLVAVSQ